MPTWLPTSRTVWVNIVVAALAILALPQVTALMTADVLRWVIAAQAVLGVILRYITVGPVQTVGQK